MTVTKRKQPIRDAAVDPDAAIAPALESGMKASCDSCSADITHSVHVRCAETIRVPVPSSGELETRLTCPDFDLCVPCFLSGKSLGPHKAQHAYRVISSHSFPIFTEDWGADEELLLVEGAEMYGLGNWADMADHVGGRSKEECEQHYLSTYTHSENYPLPTIGRDFGLDLDEFQSRKKRRLEDLQAKPLQLPPPKPLASAPTCHEIAGYMPGRLEFETEYENEAETLVKDMEFGKVYQFGGDEQPSAVPVPVPPIQNHSLTSPRPPEETHVPLAEDTKSDTVMVVDGINANHINEGEATTNSGVEAVENENESQLQAGDEPEGDLDLKLCILEMFNERYDKRVASKDLIFDRGLLNYKQLLANERKKTKEERDLILRTKVFARIQTAKDHETFVDGLLYELTLRKRIAELQEYRRMGITSLSEGERYEHAKSQRLSAKQANYRDAVIVSYDRIAARNARGPSGTPGLGNGNGASNKFGGTPLSSSSSLGGSSSLYSNHRPAHSTLTLANSASLHLLTILEKTLCSTLRILPRPYLFAKEVLLREWVRLGGRMSNMEARKAMTMSGTTPMSKNPTSSGGGGQEESVMDFGTPSSGTNAAGNTGIAAASGGGGGSSGSDWLEKIDRVWEFLIYSGGLRAPAKEKEKDSKNRKEVDFILNTNTGNGGVVSTTGQEKAGSAASDTRLGLADRRMVESM